MKEKINILCYGDSNTYGYIPLSGKRYPEEIRWTGVLAGLLGDDYRIIEEGCNGRTTVFADPFEPWKKGLDYLRPCLNTHKPVQLLIIMLGSNDLKKYFNATPLEIAEGARTIVRDAIDFTGKKQGFVPKIILVAPPIIGRDIENSPFCESFDGSAVERSMELAPLYEKTAESEGILFADSSRVAKSSKEDSLHLTPEGHRGIAGLLYEMIKEINF